MGFRRVLAHLLLVSMYIKLPREVIGSLVD